MKKVLLPLLLLTLTACAPIQEDTVVSSTPATTYIAQDIYPNSTIHTLSHPFENVQGQERELVETATVFLGHGYEPYLDNLQTEEVYLLKDYEPTIQEQTRVQADTSRYNWLNPLAVRRLGQDLAVSQQAENELVSLHNEFVNETNNCQEDIVSISNTVSHLASEHSLKLHSLYGDQEVTLSPNDLSNFIERVRDIDIDTVLHVEGFPQRTTNQIGERANLDVTLVNPTLSEDYIESMKQLQQDIIPALNCE